MDHKLHEAMDGRTKVWLAEKTGIHRNTLQSYFNGTPPPLDNAYKIARAFDTTVYEIWPDYNEK